MQDAETQFWTVDRGDYRNEYFATIERARSELGTEIAQVLSAPEACALTQQYLGSKPRILVMGQETYTNFQPLGEVFECWAQQIGGTIAFDYGYSDVRRGSTTFWKAIDEVYDTFGGKSRRALAWANICSVQRLKSFDGSYSINNVSDLFPDGGPTVRLKVVQWQASLVRAAVAYARPEAIMMLTGELSWMGKHTFAGYAERPVSCDGGHFNVVTWEGCGIPVVQTSHPGARGSKFASIRRSALKYLKAEMGSVAT